MKHRGRAEEGIPYLHPVQVCLTNLQHMLDNVSDGVCVGVCADGQSWLVTVSARNSLKEICIVSFGSLRCLKTHCMLLLNVI